VRASETRTYFAATFDASGLLAGLGGPLCLLVIARLVRVGVGTCDQWSIVIGRRTVRDVIPFVRAARVLVTLVLAALVVSLVIGIAKPETGAIEKAVLLALIAGCVLLAARLSSWSTRMQARSRRL
jgi:hypothetical protein